MPEALAAEVDEHLAALEERMGKRLGDADDPLLVSVRSGRASLDARDDGHRPQHRAERRERRGARQAVRQRAVRLGLLPAAAADVRQDRAGRRGLRGRARPGQEGQGRRPSTSTSTRTTCGRSSATSRSWSEPHTGEPFPQDPRAQMDLADRGRLRLLEHRPRPHLPPPGAHRRRPRHGRQRLLDGLRQPRHGLRHRRRLHPRPGLGRAGRLRRLPAERAGRGRRRRHPQHPAR